MFSKQTDGWEHHFRDKIVYTLPIRDIIRARFLRITADVNDLDLIEFDNNSSQALMVPAQD